MKKVILAASSGGHLEQIMCLKELGNKYECILVTEDVGYQVNGWQKRIYYFPQVNRKNSFLLIKLFHIVRMSLKILRYEKPYAVICTGVLAMIPLCIWAKIYHIKLIYIESFAKMNSPTMTGRLLYWFADIFIIQWESMRQFYPKAMYGGRIY